MKIKILLLVVIIGVAVIGIFAFAAIYFSQSKISSPTETPSVPTSNAGLENFPDKELLGENQSYSIYLVNQKTGDGISIDGEIVVYDKNRGLTLKIDGSFSIFGATIVYDDGKGKYILLSTGTYTSRTATIISLTDKKQIVKDFCTSSSEFGSQFFWNNYIIFIAHK
jgi:hypothetical protein